MKYLILALTGLISLSACVGVTYYEHSPDKKQWKASVKQLQHLHAWEVRGKLSLRQDNQIVSFDIFWQQNRENQVIRLVAPLGQGTTELRGNVDDGYTVQTNQGESLRVDSPESVSLHAFGVALPFSDIQFWMKGIPASTGEVWEARFDQQNTLTHFQQNGWDVTLKKYHQEKTYKLPSKMFIRKVAESDAQGIEKTDVRMIIRKWVI